MRTLNIDPIVKQEYLERRVGLTNLVGPYLIPLEHDLGYVMTVNDLKIPQAIFEKEFDAIFKAYMSVLDKLKELKPEVEQNKQIRESNKVIYNFQKDPKTKQEFCIISEDINDGEYPGLWGGSVAHMRAFPNIEFHTVDGVRGFNCTCSFLVTDKKVIFKG